MVEIEGTDQSLGTCGVMVGGNTPTLSDGIFTWQTERCNWPLDYSNGSGVCPMHGVALPIVRGR